jgi:deoxyribodipyrimidine photo-lyase
VRKRSSDPVPEIRLRDLNRRPVRADGEYVLYWMIAARRACWNFALDHAVDLARRLDRPLVVLEALRLDYPWASERLHRFILEGMADNVRAFRGTSVLYYPYIEPDVGAGRGLLETLAARACVVVTDDYPAFFLPRMAAAAAQKLSVRLTAVDSNGLLPLRAAGAAFARAYDFRRFLQRELPHHGASWPRNHPLLGLLRPFRRRPLDIARRWPSAEAALVTEGPALLQSLPFRRTVSPVPYPGGTRAGRQALKTFLKERLDRYLEERRHPDSDATSGLAPYLHFGHLSVHEVFAAIAEREEMEPTEALVPRGGGRSGGWGMSPAAEAFLDQLVTWRELGFNFCAYREDYDRYESLPAWARRTLEQHAGDRRPYLYSLEQFERADTHDPLWNAAQNQLRVEGRLHNSLRMLWGKKILHWSESPRAALEIMIELNNAYAVDGRDPNSYSGIFWVLGRYDRPWGPERAVFGKIRYMSSENARRKLRVDQYVRRWTAVQAKP